MRNAEAKVSIELLQVLVSTLRLHGGLYDSIALLDFGKLGYVVVGLFLLAWGSSVAVWRFGRIEERYGGVITSHCHTHTHTHDGGIEHSYEHLH